MLMSRVRLIAQPLGAKPLPVVSYIVGKFSLSFLTPSSRESSLLISYICLIDPTVIPRLTCISATPEDIIIGSVISINPYVRIIRPYPHTSGFAIIVTGTAYSSSARHLHNFPQHPLGGGFSHNPV